MTRPLDLNLIENDILEYTSADVNETEWEDYIKPQIRGLLDEVKRLREFEQNSRARDQMYKNQIKELSIQLHRISGKLPIENV